MVAVTVTVIADQRRRHHHLHQRFTVAAAVGQFADLVAADWMDVGWKSRLVDHRLVLILVRFIARRRRRLIIFDVVPFVGCQLIGIQFGIGERERRFGPDGSERVQSRPGGDWRQNEARRERHRRQNSRFRRTGRQQTRQLDQIFFTAMLFSWTMAGPHAIVSQFADLVVATFALVRLQDVRSERIEHVVHPAVRHEIVEEERRWQIHRVDQFANAQIEIVFNRRLLLLVLLLLFRLDARMMVVVVVVVVVGRIVVGRRNGRCGHVERTLG